MTGHTQICSNKDTVLGWECSRANFSMIAVSFFGYICFCTHFGSSHVLSKFGNILVFLRIKVSADPAGLFQQLVTLNLELSSIPVTETGSLNNSSSTVLKTLIIMGKLKLLLYLRKLLLIYYFEFQPFQNKKFITLFRIFYFI